MSDGIRGQPILDVELCFSCGLCSHNCPTLAIEMVEVKGKKYPRIDLGKCIFCYKCSDDCPSGAMKNSTAFEMAAVNQTSLAQKPKPTSNDKKSPKKGLFGR